MPYKFLEEIFYKIRREKLTIFFLKNSKQFDTMKLKKKLLTHHQRPRI